VEGLGGVVVGCAVLVELAALGGRRKISPHALHAVISYD
jgi:adenine/guanine phosphoribosyltransferase-like PRPP-binding protein